MNCIIVPSHKRADLLLSRELTLSWVMAQTKYPVFLALRHEDVPDYLAVLRKYPSLQPLTIAPHIASLGPTLDHVIQVAYTGGYEKALIYDDDLLFSYREWGSTRLPQLPRERFIEVAEAHFAALSEETPHAGLRHRAFAQNCTAHMDYYKRIMWTHGVHLPTIAPDSRLRFEWPGKVMTDFHFGLSVIAAGYSNCVLNDFTADDAVGPYKNSGGCNTYRNNEMRTKAAYMLLEKFPLAVSLREKDTPEGSYTDVTVRFKAAYTAS